jgi:hypothetical protein
MLYFTGTEIGHKLKIWQNVKGIFCSMRLHCYRKFLYSKCFYLRKTVLLSVFVLAMILGPLAEKIVSPKISFQESNLAETIADGVLWHPVFDLNCYGDPECVNPVEFGHSLGANFVVLNQSVFNHTVKITFFEYFSSPSHTPRDHLVALLLEPPRPLHIT